MERVCFVGRVRVERLEEYRARIEDGLLIGYLETDDYQAALARMAKTE